MKKKKILLTTGISAVAVVAGVSPAIASSTSVQSSTLDVDSKDPVNPNNPTEPGKPVDPSNPTDPDNPVDPSNPTDPDEPKNPVEPTLLVAKVPSSDHFTMSNIKVNSSTTLFIYTYQQSLNTYLKNLFATENFFESNKDLFTNSNEYANVSVSYVDNSANYANKTFKLRATPVENAFFEDKNNQNEDTENKDAQPKEITVNIDQQILIAESCIPIKNTVSYGVKIDGSNIKSDEDLNKYFETELKSFQIKNFSNQSVFVKDKTSVFDWNFTNVNIEYVKDSSSLENKTIKIKVTPIDGYAWSYVLGSKISVNDPVELTIKIVNFDSSNVTDSSDIIDSSKIISLPERWSNSIVLNSIYRGFSNREYLTWDMLGFFFDTSYLNYNVNIPENKKRFDDQKSLNEWYFFREGIKELAKYYPVEEAYWNAIRYDSVERVSGGIALDYSILCYPKAGYYWEDGTNKEKWIPMRLFVSSEWDVGQSWVLGSTYDLTDIINYNKENEKNPLPSRSWVTNKLLSVKNDLLLNGTFEENKKIVEKIIMDDLEKQFPDYYIQISDLQSASPNEPNDIKGNWKYKVRFILKSDKFAISDFINGYIFSDGWPAYN